VAATYWFTGLSAAGKTTLAKAVRHHLSQQGIPVVLLDGDELRQGPHRGLGFSHVDREENVRRTALLARLLNNQGFVVLVSLISPTKEIRELARQLVGAGCHFEIFVKSSIDVCIARDPKGLYARARAGELIEFTGISSPYEEPIAPHLEVCTDNLSVEECVESILNLINGRRSRI